MRKAILILAISIAISILSTCIFSIYEDSSSNTPENMIVTEETETDANKESEENVVNLEKTGTLDNITLIVDIISVESIDGIQLIVGNTATEKNYSGKIHIKSDSINEFEINKTYTFIVEPLISMSIPPVAVEVTHSESDSEDIEMLHKYREIASNYNDKLLEYKNMSLQDIIADSNNSYYTWTNEQINQFKGYIEDLGYDEEFEIKSEVVIRSIPNKDADI